MYTQADDLKERRSAWWLHALAWNCRLYYLVLFGFSQDPHLEDVDITVPRLHIAHRIPILYLLIKQIIKRNMKRILLSTILLMTFLSSWAQFSGEGSGTEDDPYRITNALQLTQIANSPSSYFQLQNDIDLTEWIVENSPRLGWIPINGFSGIFDGQNHVISGLYINSTQSNTGFWGSISYAEIKNLTIKGSDVIGRDRVGTFVGASYKSTLMGCHAVLTGTLTSNYSSEDYSSYSIGGICGSLTSGKCNNCSFCGNIESELCSGGIVGYGINEVHSDSYSATYAQISNNCFTGNIKTNRTAGGIVGVLCYYRDSYTKRWQAGAYEWYSSTTYYYRGCELSNNLVKGEITANKAGGILGWAVNKTGSDGSINHHEITNNIVNAIITGENNWTGGICGQAYLADFSRNVLVNSSITNKAESYLHRIADNQGGNDIAENGSSSSNRVSVTTRTFVNDEEVFLDDDIYNGMTVGLAALRNKDNYIGWGYDFDTDWAIVDGVSFPYKPYMAAPPVIDETPAPNATTISGTCQTGGKVYLYYNDSETPISTTCVGNRFTFNISPLIEGSTVKLYADNDITTSYTMESTVGSGSSSSTIAVASVTLNKSAITLAPNYSFQLSATVLPLTASNRSVNWVTSNNSVATVSDNGLVTAKAEGTATISCTANDGSGQRATCVVTVSNDAAAASGLKGDMNDDGVVDTQDALLIIKQYVGKE